jgi:hypothetical protein
MTLSALPLLTARYRVETSTQTWRMMGMMSSNYVPTAQSLRLIPSIRST